MTQLRSYLSKVEIGDRRQPPYDSNSVEMTPTASK